MSISVWDTEELAHHLLGLDEETDYDVTEQKLFDKYEMSMDSFHKVIEDILPLVNVGKSPLSDTMYKGFSKVEDGVGIWIIKQEVKQ